MTRWIGGAVGRADIDVVAVYSRTHAVGHAPLAVDVLTSASRDGSYGAPPTDLYGH